MEELTTLVIDAQDDDLDAFVKIVARFQDMAYACAYTMLGDAHLAEDAAQEAFIEAFLCLPKLREPAAFPGWFRKIVFKHGDRLMRGKHLSTVPVDVIVDQSPGDTDPAATVETSEMNGMVRRAIVALPPHERIVTALFYLAGYGQKDIAKFLEIPVTTVKKRLYNARKRLKERMLDMVDDALYEQRPSHDDRFSNTVQFLLAVRIGDLAKVKELLARDPALVNAREDWNYPELKEYPYSMWSRSYTPLHRAAKNGHTAVAKLLVANGADVNAKTDGGETPLHGAALMNHNDMMELLLMHGTNANAVFSGGLTPGLTVLHWVTMRGYRDLAEVLLSKGAQVNIKDYAGRTPLHWAAIKGYNDLVELLLSYQANINAKDETGRTPLAWAFRNGHMSIVDMLRQRGASA